MHARRRRPGGSVAAGTGRINDTDPPPQVSRSVAATPDAIDRWLEAGRTILPNPELAGLYDRYHALYLELYRRNKELMHEIRTLV